MTSGVRAPLWHYLAYTRPRSIPVTLAMAATGWLASPAHARSWEGALGDLAWLALVHSVLLWGGSNALNSAEDRDEGPVNLLPNPPPLPPRLGAFGVLLLLVAVPAAATRGPTCAALAALAGALSVFYSWRGAPWLPTGWRRGKEIPGVDNLVNAAGCGFGSFGFGWAATGAPITPEALLLGLGWTVCLFGGMPTAQLFQLAPNDTGATARNWTAWLGAPRTLRLGSGLFLAHLAILGPLTFGGGPSMLAIAWVVGVLLAAAHSFWWSFDPWRNAYGRMLRQMTVLTTAQVAWAFAQA